MTLKPCPFCGSPYVDPKGWASTDRAGPACDDCGGSADTVELWNTRPGEVQTVVEATVLSGFWIAGFNSGLTEASLDASRRGDRDLEKALLEKRREFSDWKDSVTAGKRE